MAAKHVKGITRRQFLLAGSAALATSGCFRQVCVSGPEVSRPVAGPSIQPPPICQFAFSVLNLDRTRAWYRNMLGFVPSGGTNDFGNPIGSWIQGLPNVDVVTKWMVDQQEFMQLEMFEFKSPVPKPRPMDWAPNNSGYTIIGVHVANFDATLTSLRTSGVQTLTDPIGAPGRRRVCIKDPEGNIVELMEEDPRQGAPKSRPRPRPQVGVVARSITVSVPDVNKSRRFFVDTLRLEECTDFVLHGPEHEGLWNLKGATAKTVLLWAGDVLVELRQYTNPVAKSWPKGYRISDQGMLNIAFGFRRRDDFDEACTRVFAAGYRSNSPPFHLLDWGVVYVNDDQCFSVELLLVEPAANKKMGFEPENEVT
jgi:catechol 2,3-dioxygenase-like lactoylglutathione lyase family enzyme